MNNSNQISNSCEAEMYDGSLCGRSIYKNGLCILHSHDKQKGAKFNKEIIIEYRTQKETKEYFDFTSFDFPDSFSFAGFEFNKRAYFSFCIFQDLIDFSKTIFMQEVFFNDVRFQKYASFGSTIFKKADFSNSIFFDSAMFHNAIFKDDVNFKSCEFQNLAYFRKTQFEKSSFFKFSKFLDVCRFDEAIFYKNVDFSYAIFNKRSTFKETEFKSKFESIDFTSTYFDDVYFLFDDLKKFEIKKNLKKINKLKKFRFSLGEKSAKRFPILNRTIKDAWFLDDFKRNYPIIFFLWNVFSKCGQSLLRWALWSLAIVMFFSVNFYSIYLNYPGSLKISVETLKTPTIWTFIYYSVVTFTTLGFGDIVPAQEWVQRWVIAEVIIGYIMLGGLISIFSNKLARRS